MYIKSLKLIIICAMLVSCAHKESQIVFTVGMHTYGNNFNYEKALRDAVNTVLSHDSNIKSWEVSKITSREFRVQVHFAKKIKIDENQIKNIQNDVIQNVIIGHTEEP